MRVALLLVVALLCVALASAGSGRDKNRAAKQNSKADSWQGKKDSKDFKSKQEYKREEKTRRDDKRQQENKENEIKNKKRNKREGTEAPLEQDGKRGKDAKQYHKRKDESSKRAAEEESSPLQTERPSKKKPDKVETMPKEGKKSTSKTEREEKKENVEEEPAHDVTVETEETAPEEDVDGECVEDTAEKCGREPEVTLSSGSKLSGRKGTTQAGRTTAEFTGVPYAERPQAEHRFKEAVMMDTWPGVLQATVVGNDCLQYSHFTYSVIGSEDCLYLNIYTPKVPKKDNKEALMPVIVYIHGGAFMFFSSALGGPRYLLDEDIVLVTFNYRLGPLGFFRLEDDSVPGNLGLRDQLLALKWIQKHINSFGGDPARVTLAGMSAGAASVHYHLLSPLSTGLFSKGILISGSALNPWAEAEEVVSKSHEVARKLGCEVATSQQTLTCLRSRSADKIVATAKDMQVWLYNPISPWAPSPEPKTASKPFLPDSPINIILHGKSQDIPLLISWTNNEGGYPGAEFVFDPILLEYLEENWTRLLPHILEYNHTAPSGKLIEVSLKIKEFYLKGKPANDLQSVGPLIDMQSDRLFLLGLAEEIRAHVDQQQAPIFTYRFSHVGRDSVALYLCHCNQTLEGACHADDVGYLLDAMSPLLWTPEEFQLSKQMVGLWKSFITTGVPVFKGQDLPRVSRFQESIPFLDIGQNGETRLLSDSDLGNQAFWSTLGLSDLSRSETTHPRDEL